MPAATYNITIEQGTDWTRDLFLTTATQGTIDVSGRTFSAQIRQYPSGTVATAIACSVVSAAGGQVRMSVTSAASLAVPTAGAKYDLLMVTSAGISTRLLEGSVTLSPRITVP
jgi:ribonuclease PH